MPPPVIAAAAIATTAVGIQQKGVARGKQEKAGKAQQRMADIRAARSRRAQIAEGRRARAAITAQATQSGIAGSSAEAGARGSVGSQVAANVSFLDSQQSLAGSVSRLNQSAQDSLSNAGTAQAIANASQLFQE